MKTFKVSVAQFCMSFILIASCDFVFGIIHSTQVEAAKLNTCQKLYQNRYLRAGPHKAIATTGGRSLSTPYTSCGFSDQKSTKKRAINEALAECRRQAKKYNRSGACTIIDSR